MSQVQLTKDLLRQRDLEIKAYIEFLKVAVERRAVLSARDGEMQFPLTIELTHSDISSYPVQTRWS